MPEVPPGSLYLGARLDPTSHERTTDAVLYDAANLTTHGVIVGMTGSGKTGLGIVLLEEALLAGIPVLVLDPKGDMGNLALIFPQLEAAQFAPWVDAGDAARQGRTVDQVAADAATSWKEGLAGWDIDGARIQRLHDAADITLYTPGSNVGVPLDMMGDLRAPAGGADPELLQDEVEGLVSALLGLVGVDSDPLSGREHILLANLVAGSWAAGRDLDLASLVHQVQDPPVRKLGVIDLDTFFPPADRTALAMRLNGLLASAAFASWAQGVPLDIEAMLHGTDGRPRAAIVELAHLSDEERQFVVTLVLSKVVTWFRRQPGTANLRALIYMDEVVGYVPPSAAPPAKKPILTIFKQARAFGVGMVLATQNPVDIDYKALSNAGTWLVGRLQTERDKARLMDGLAAATGTSDPAALGDTLSGLRKREFLFHTTSSDHPFTFTTRWAMSYLRGPLSREQITALSADRRSPSTPEPAAITPAAAADATAPSVPSVAAPAALSLADDESSVPPTVAAGIRVAHLDPAAAWAAGVGASPTGRRLQAAVVARCQLLFDDTKADLRQQQEWEAVVFPLAATFDAASARQVDYDDRDLRDAAPDGPGGPGAVVYVLPDAPVGSKPWWTAARSDLTGWLLRNLSLQLFRNAELKLYSRPGESEADFRTRCAAAADDAADVETDKLRATMLTRLQRARDAVAKAEDKVREGAADRDRKRRDAAMDAGAGILGGLLGGRRNSRSILSSLSRVVSRGGVSSQAAERMATAENRLDERRDAVAELEADLAARLQAINDEADARAGRIDTIDVPLERADIEVDELALVWVRTD